MARALKCTLTTPEDKVFEGDIQAITLPAVDGELGILPGHAPLVSTIGFGELRVTTTGDTRHNFFVEGGFVQILGEQVSVLAASAAAVEDLDRAGEESRLMELRDQRPARNADLEQRDEYARRVAIVKSRLKLAGRAN